MDLSSVMTQTFLGSYWKTFLIGIPVALCSLKLLKTVFMKIVVGDPYYSVTEYKENTVYLFTFPRKLTRQLLNLSPYAVKLESWLRLKGVKYVFVETNQFSKSTRQMPYILYNGVEYVDTLLIVDQLASVLDLPKDDLSLEQKGISRAFIRMVDEGLSMTHFMFRYYFMANDFFGRLFRPKDNAILVKIFKMIFKKVITKRGRLTGLGRHDKSVIGDIGKDDIRAISKYLGDKKFMFGDKINTVDCAIFGQLSQIVYIDLDFPHKVVLDSECSNIKPYLERIKETLWPDWDDLINPLPFTK